MKKFLMNVLKTAILLQENERYLEFVVQQMRNFR